MGGTHSSNLMSDVNVLIVGDRNTEKFKFSVKHRADLKFVKPEAIIKIHSIWLNNEDQPNPDLINIDNHLLPIFEGFSICLSRISTDDHINADEKKTLIKLIQDNGGIVSDSLTTTSSCLITNEKSGKRYEMSKKWQTPIIHPLWIIHSIKRKAAMDFQYYDIEINDISKIGENSCMAWDDLKKRKKKKIIVEENEEISKKDSEIWNSIMQVNNSNKLKLHRKESSWDDELQESLEQQQQQSTIIKKQDSKKLSPIITSHLFKDLSFQIEFFESSKKSTLIKVIESHSGKIVDSFPSFLIIPSDFLLDDLPKDLQKNELVTEWFIERCLHYNTIKLDDWGKPFLYKLPQLPKLDLSVTGFQGVELLHLTKLINLLGFNYHDVLNKDRDLLILNLEIVNINKKSHLFEKFPSLFNTKQMGSKSDTTHINSTRKKIKFSKQKCIPIVSITYLFTIFQERNITNINRRDWCIYCPKLVDLKPKLTKLLGDDSTISKEKVEKENKNDTQNDEEHKNPSLPQLPSPIRNKRKDNWGRLVGRASKSQLDSLGSEQQYDDSEFEKDFPKTTQISYGNSETNAKVLKLLNKSDQLPNEDKHYNEKSLEPARKRTRANYKEMLDVLDNN